MVRGQLGNVNQHVVRGDAVFGAAEGAVILLAGFAGVENVGGKHHLHEHPLATRIANDATEGADDVRIHRANRAHRADRVWLIAVPDCNESSEPTLDHLNEGYVGAIEPELWARVIAVVNFASHGWATQARRLNAVLEILHAGEWCRDIDRGRLGFCGWACGWAATREREACCG